MAVRIIYCCPSLMLCTWEGRQFEIVDHIKREHPDILMDTNEFPLAVNKDYTINYVMHYKEGEVYLVQVDLCDGKAQVRVRFSGNAQTAASKRYSIQVQADDMVLSNKHSETNRFFYPPIKNQQGMVEIDVNFLKNTWKVQDFLMCRINFEEPSSKMPITPGIPLLRDVAPSAAEPESLKGLSMKESKKFISSSSRSTLKSKSIHKSDQSLFYLNEFLQESQEAEDLMDLLDERITLLKDYKCKNCDHYITGPIFRCTSDHSICHGCISDDWKCACKSDVNAEQRNSILEQTRDLTNLPCRFDGCNVSVIGAKLQEHEVQCSHCVYICPVCKHLIGKYTEVEKHFRIVHPSVKRVYTLENSFPNDSHFVVLHSLGVFYCNHISAANSIEWSVEHCGHIKIYFECEVLLKSNKMNTSKNYKLEKSEKTDEKNLLKRCVSMREVKISKIKNVVLRISLYKPFS